MQPAIINTALYPVDDLGSPAARDWIAAIRASLEQDGSCLLADFVAPDRLAQIVQQVQGITHLAYPGPNEVSPYFFNYQLGKGKDLPESYPLRHRGKRNLAQVAANLIPDEYLLREPLINSE